MLSATQREAEKTQSAPASRFAVAIGRRCAPGGAYQVESPDRLLRMLALLTEADDELRQADLPPRSLARVQRQLAAVSAEISNGRCPRLSLTNCTGCWDTWMAEPGPREVRIEYVALLGGLSGLVIGMLSQLEAARNDQQLADASLPGPRSP